jgi:hypothetical protein
LASSPEYWGGEQGRLIFIAKSDLEIAGSKSDLLLNFVEKLGINRWSLGKKGGRRGLVGW